MRISDWSSDVCSSDLNIGTFTKTAKGYAGEIVTMSVQQKKVRIEAETDVQNDKAPTHRVFVGRAEIGAGWAKQSKEGRDYLSLKLDDPSYAAHTSATLLDRKSVVSGKSVPEGLKPGGCMK